ncbi:hypothetical protein ACIRPU_42475 [Streptomyces sp. NPDC102259]|uniref:hypothetical protein n=1 Tax=Streptomyces sp. NPDC102259 TaxID=3366148 RepID=UPI00380E39C2
MTVLVIGGSGFPGGAAAPVPVRFQMRTVPLWPRPPSASRAPGRSMRRGGWRSWLTDIYIEGPAWLPGVPAC